MDDDNPLDLIDTEALITELSNRFDGMVLITLRDIDGEETGVRWFGGYMQSLGMLAAAHGRMLKKHTDEGDYSDA